MSTSEHILVVDDDPDIRELVRLYLDREGYSVSTAPNGAAMRRTMAEVPVGLVILDLLMPGEDGLALTRHLRETSDVAIIILTVKGDTVDRVIGLEMGADDYIAKPFDLRELLARVRSLLRRSRGTTQDKPVSMKAQFSGWQLDLATYQLFSPAGAEVVLTSGEFELLVAFVNHPGRTLSRDELLNLTRDRDASPFDRSIDVQVGRLRRKIEVDPSQPMLIKTVRSAGYLFTPTVEST